MRKPVATWIAACLALIAATSCGSNGAADGDAVADENAVKDVPASEEGKLNTAASVIEQALEDDETGIPEALLERAYGIAVVPNVVKAALGVGGRWGKGVIAKRLDDGSWSAPVNISMGGASYGFQIGASSTDLVLVFTDPKGVEHVLGDRLKLGADAGVTAGPIGRNVEIGTNARAGTAIYSYSRSEGLFAGVSVDGAVIEVDETANEEMYGEGVTPSDILSGDVSVPDELLPFVHVLNTRVPEHHEG